ALLDDLVTCFPAEPEYRFSLAACLDNSWNALNQPGRQKEAEGACHRALALLEELTRTSSLEPKHLRLFADASCNLGETLGQAGCLPEAAEHYRNAIAAYQKLTPNITGLPEYEHDLLPFEWHNLGVAYRQLGNGLGRTGKLEEALEAFAQALRIHEKL